MTQPLKKKQGGDKKKLGGKPVLAPIGQNSGAKNAPSIKELVLLTAQLQTEMDPARRHNHSRKPRDKTTMTLGVKTVLCSKSQTASQRTFPPPRSPRFALLTAQF